MVNAYSTDELNLKRTLSTESEGTPSFKEVDFNGTLKTSKFTLVFHYMELNYKD